MGRVVAEEVVLVVLAPANAFMGLGMAAFEVNAVGVRPERLLGMPFLILRVAMASTAYHAGQGIGLDEHRTARHDRAVEHLRGPLALVLGKGPQRGRAVPRCGCKEGND